MQNATVLCIRRAALHFLAHIPKSHGGRLREIHNILRGLVNCMYTNAPERYFKKLCEKNGLPRVSLHSLRHLNASLLIHAGLDIKTVQTSLGHSSATTTLDIYAHEFQMAQSIASAVITNALELTLESKKGA